MVNKEEAEMILRAGSDQASELYERLCAALNEFIREKKPHTMSVIVGMFMFAKEVGEKAIENNNKRVADIIDESCAMLRDKLRQYAKDKSMRS